MGSCDVTGRGRPSPREHLRDEQHPSNGSSVSGAGAEEHQLPVPGISLSGIVLSLPRQRRLSSGETRLQSSELSISFHYELSKTVAQGLRVQIGRGVFLDWWQRGRAAKMEAGSDG